MNPISRRWFLKDCGLGFGSIAAADLLARQGLAQGVSMLASREQVTIRGE